MELAAPPLNAIQRQARFGPKYLSLVVAQAGGHFTETSIDEDTLAIDATVRLNGGFIVDVQVKSTHQYAVDGAETSLKWPLKRAWVRKWRNHPYPLYVVIVVMPDDSATWLDHTEEGTMLKKSAAYWARVDTLALDGTKSITVPRSQRLTQATMALWLTDSRAGFGSGGAQ